MSHLERGKWGLGTTTEERLLEWTLALTFLTTIPEVVVRWSFSGPPHEVLNGSLFVAAAGIAYCAGILILLRSTRVLTGPAHDEQLLPWFKPHDRDTIQRATALFQRIEGHGHPRKLETRARELLSVTWSRANRRVRSPATSKLEELACAWIALSFVASSFVASMVKPLVFIGVGAPLLLGVGGLVLYRKVIDGLRRVITPERHYPRHFDAIFAIGVLVLAAFSIRHGPATRPYYLDPEPWMAMTLLVGTRVIVLAALLAVLGLRRPLDPVAKRRLQELCLPPTLLTLPLLAIVFLEPRAMVVLIFYAPLTTAVWLVPTFAVATLVREVRHRWSPWFVGKRLTAAPSGTLEAQVLELERELGGGGLSVIPDADSEGRLSQAEQGRLSCHQGEATVALGSE